MNEIPIFDSLTHPTINSDWILPRYPKKSNIDYLLSEMEKYNIVRALAVGMLGIGGYDEDRYVKFIKSKTDKLIPIAFFDVNLISSRKDIQEKIKTLKKKGYKGIKLHPRIGKINLTNNFLPEIIKIANDLNLAVLLCTYFYDTKIGSYLNNTTNLIALLEKVPDAKIILLHGGGVKLLEYMEIARAFSNVLLDLSFTFCKYEKSSLDMDIKFLFEKFDRRICIGTDYPEFSYFQLRRRFMLFAKNIEKEKLQNIAFNNLQSFIN